MTPVTHSTRLNLNLPPPAPFVPPSRDAWDLLFQPIFDELLNPPAKVVSQALVVIGPAPEVIAPVNDDSTGTPSSTTIDQDAPSLSNSPTEPEPSQVIPTSAEGDDHDIKFTHMDNDSYFGVPIPKVQFEESSSSDTIHRIVHPITKFLNTLENGLRTIHVKISSMNSEDQSPQGCNYISKLYSVTTMRSSLLLNPRPTKML
ncbi:hypothetical protein Tco_0386207 [Tanacetum coccineum]